MRKTFWITLLPLLVAICAPNAHADTYAISFTGTDVPTIVGSDLIDYNPGIQEFTTPSFTMIWNGQTFVMENTNPLNQVNIVPSEITWGCAVDFFGAFQCIITNIYGTPLAGTVTEIYIGFGGPDLNGTNPLSTGSVILTAQTPEPAAGGLMFLGLGFVLVMRKHIGLSLHQAG